MAANRAKEMLEKGGFKIPPAWEGGEALLRLARDSATTPAGWFAAIEDADVESIIAAIAGLSELEGADRSEATIHRRRAFREAARAVVDAKLTGRTIREMKRLEKVGIGLAFVGLLVAIPSAVIAIHQIGMALGWW